MGLVAVGLDAFLELLSNSKGERERRDPTISSVQNDQGSSKAPPSLNLKFKWVSDKKEEESRA